MIWPHRIQMIVPAAILQIANAIGIALDPDSGGGHTFTVPLPSVDNPTHYGASTAAAESFVQAVAGIFSGAVDLHQMVSADYAARQPDLTPPTAEDCATFLAQAVIRVDQPWGVVLEELGLQLESESV